MPSILPPGGGTSADALNNLKFSNIPPGGGLVNGWVSGATAADTFGFSDDSRELVVQGSECNIELSADVITIDRDQVIFDELMLPGQMFLPVVATAEVQFLIHIHNLRPIGGLLAA